MKRKTTRVLFLAALLLLVLVSGALGILLSVTHHPNTATLPRATQTRTPEASASPSITTTPLPIYPQFATNYGGTISDTGVAGTTTKLFLSNVRQNQGNFSGNFSGLSEVGPFTGTITSAGDFTFRVKISIGFLICTGHTKVGGELVGTFKVVNEQGISQGEYGPWTADPTHT